MNKILKIGLTVIAILAVLFSAFIAYAYYVNPRLDRFCCVPDPGEVFTSEFVDRGFLFRFTRDGGGFGGRSLIIEINGDGTFEKTTNPPFGNIDNSGVEKGRLSEKEISLLVSRIESSNFFNFPREMNNYDCFDAPGTSLTISLDNNSHTVSEYCSFTSEGDEYHSLVSLASQMTTQGGYRK